MTQEGTHLAADETLASLLDLYIRFADALMPRIDQWSSEERLQGRAEVRPFFRPIGMNFSPEAMGGHRRVLDNHQPLIVEMPEYQECRQAHLNAGLFPVLESSTDATVSAPDTPQASTSVPISQQESAILVRLLEPIIDLRDCHAFHLDGAETSYTQADLISSYEQAKADWVFQEPRWKIVALLLNFATDIEHPVLLGDEVVLRPFTSDEKNRLWQRVNGGTSQFGVGTVRLLDAGDVRMARHCIVADVPPGNASFDDRVSAVGGRIWGAVTSLRLLKRGNVGISEVVIVPTSPETHGRSLSLQYYHDLYYDRRQYDWMRKSPQNKYMPPYNLEQAEVAGLLQVFHNLGDATEADTKKIHVALDRFNSCYGRYLMSDRIIDACISLENLFLWDGNTELNYRLALRIAALLGRERDPKELMRQIKIIYNTRSSVVHGAEKHVSEDEAFNCEEIVRTCLKLFLSRLGAGKTIEDIHAEIEERIVNGLSLIPFTPAQ